MNAPDIWSAIEHAYAHEDVAAEAQRLWAQLSPNLFLPHKLELSASNAGDCVLAVWAKLNRRTDIPEDWASMLCKPDGGTMYGLRVATLFGAGYRATHPDAEIRFEVVSDYEGVPGHIDFVVIDGGIWCGEIKTTFWTNDFSGPMDSHFTQAAIYALGQRAEGFSIFTLLPAAQKRGGNPAVHHVQTDRYTEDYVEEVRAEIARLQGALGSAPPKQDVKEAWRCSYCRFGACPKNRNILKPKPAEATV